MVLPNLVNILSLPLRKNCLYSFFSTLAQVMLSFSVSVKNTLLQLNNVLKLIEGSRVKAKDLFFLTFCILAVTDS